MPVRCGIDLGTTYSSISWYDSFNNRVETIELNSADGMRMIRSVVYYPGPGQPPVVGDAAWNAKRHEPDRVVVGIKRSMGSDYKTPAIDGHEYTPPEVSAEILKVLVQDAQQSLGEAVTEVVITTPAHFGDNERAATLDAGKLAGLNVIAILPEPHGAALAYSIDKVADINNRTLLVYDLGGGTFDVTMIRARTTGTGDTLNLKIDTLCKEGNAHLGGLNWDRVLGEIVAEKVQQAHNIDVWDDPKNEAVLLDNCEKAKRNLTSVPSTKVVADLAGHEVEVTRDEFEDRTRDLLLQSQALVTLVLAEAESKHQIPRDSIDVLLAGGSSRMPMVKQMLKGLLGRDPLTHKNPDLLVTIGAAYWAHLSGREEAQTPIAGEGIPLAESAEPATVGVAVKGDDGKMVRKELSVAGLTDVSMYPVGVEVLRPDGQGGFRRCVSEVIPVGARYSEVHEKPFVTSEDNMTMIPITLYKGEMGKPVEECERIMDIFITDLPANRPRGQPVKVRLQWDTDGIIRGEALDVNTNKGAPIVEDRTKKE